METILSSKKSTGRKHTMASIPNMGKKLAEFERFAGTRKAPLQYRSHSDEGRDGEHRT